MRVSRLFMAAGLALIVAISSAAILSAQAKTDEDYDTLMKGVGAANAAIAKATDGATIAAEAKKLQAFFKDAQQFWTARKNTEAADYGGVSHDACRRDREGGDREQHGRRGRRTGRNSAACARRATRPIARRPKPGFAIQR